MSSHILSNSYKLDREPDLNFEEIKNENQKGADQNYVDRAFDNDITENQNIEQSLITGDEEAELVTNSFLTKLPDIASLKSK